MISAAVVIRPGALVLCDGLIPPQKSLRPRPVNDVLLYLSFGTQLLRGPPGGVAGAGFTLTRIWPAENIQFPFL